jgi:hypothetical protein
MRSEKGVSRIIFKIIHHLCNSIDPASISDFVKYDSKRSYLRVSIVMVCFFAWIVCNSFIFLFIQLASADRFRDPKKFIRSQFTGLNTEPVQPRQTRYRIQCKTDYVPRQLPELQF